MTRLPVATEWFTVRRHTLGIWVLTEPHVHWLLSANVCLVEGGECDVVFDTGNGIVPLAPVIDAIRSDAAKPMVAVASHAHADHAGGLHEFADRRAHRLEAETVAAGGQAPPLLASSWRSLFGEDHREETHDLPDVLLSRVPSAGFDARRFTTPAAEPTSILLGGESIDLGDRSLEVLHLPGHSPGSIGLWDERGGLLLSGDAAYEGGIIDALPGGDIEAYVRTMQVLRDLPVTAVLPGHGDTFDGDRLADIARDYIAERS
jgi:glyoxylase-like metal-dependent hydrolase (beta-lactamase superfamily II)